MNGIEIKNLTKKYKDLTAVDELNLNIVEGELFGLLGVNGAGKTTTIKMLSCLTSPTSGNATLLGNSIVKEPNKVKKIINLSPQETAIAPKLTVKENLEFIANIYDIPKNKIAEEVEIKLQELNLKKVENKRTAKLSGGYQRRLSIAMALISDPKILFLDEPTLGLDVLAKRELWEIIKKLKKKTTIILTTHYMEEAEMLCDRIAIMKEGKIIAIGTSKELIKESKTKTFEDAFVKLVSEVK